MSRLAVLVQRIAPRDVTVLLTGESGTGKERIAEALVQASTRADKPFMRFNCAALTAELAEAELFGHTRGAFTGAVKARPGLFREADGGTILLDEIGELPLHGSGQAACACCRRARCGPSAKISRSRSTCASSRRPIATSCRWRRKASFARTSTIGSRSCICRCRRCASGREDIPLLARHFLGECARRFGVGPFKLTPSLLERLNAYVWPGNVRELENAIESAVALSPGHELDLSLLPEPRRAAATRRRRPRRSPPSTRPADGTTVAPI